MDQPPWTVTFFMARAFRSLQGCGVQHRSSGKVSAVNPQGDVLHGGKGEQLEDSSHSIWEKRNGNHGSRKKFHHGHGHHADPRRGDGEEGDHVNKHTKGRGYARTGKQREQKKKEGAGAFRKHQPIGGGNKKRKDQDGQTAQYRLGKAVGQASCVPHAVKIDRAAQLVGDIAVNDGIKNLVFHHPGHEQRKKGLLQPDVRAGGGERHGKRAGIRPVKGPEHQNFHGTPHKLRDNSRKCGGSVLQSHTETESEKCQIFSITFHAHLPKSDDCGKKRRALPPCCHSLCGYHQWFRQGESFLFR